MELILLYILYGYFFLGGIAVFFISRKKNNDKKRKDRVKYFVYLFIVNLLFISILLNKGVFHYICIVIILFGFFEIIRQTIITKKIKVGSISLFFFLLFAVGFYFFSNLKQEYLFYVLFIVTIFDALSQISGQVAGKTKILPNISPNKTLEGLLGGLLFSVITSLLIRDLLEIDILQSLIIGFEISIFSFLGDILASYSKRKFGVKDFSKLIPGHGGFLDRFDSLIVAGFIMFSNVKFGIL